MEIPGNLLLPALLFITIGFIVGALIATLLADRSRGNASDEEKTVSAASDKTPASEEPYTGLPLERFDPLVRLYREKSSGKLVTEVDRKIFLNPETIPPDQLRMLRDAAEDWTAWLGIQPPAPVTVEQQPLKVEPFTTTPAFAPEPAVVAAVEKPRATTMIGQIDEILQEMLALSPMAGRTVHITQEPSLGVTVWVDTNRYQGIDAVPDPQVKELIRAAVKHWEQTGDSL